MAFTVTVPTPDAIELLEAVRTELDCDRLDGARVAFVDYWANRKRGNGTAETDRQARALAVEIAALTDAIAGGDLADPTCHMHSTAGYGWSPARG